MTPLPFALALTLAAAPSATEVTGNATLPLQEVLALYAQPKAPAPPAPPMDALVTKATLTGRLTEDAVLVDAHLEVHVLATGKWAQLELFELGGGTRLVEADEGCVSAHQGKVLFLSSVASRYTCDFKLELRAARAGDQRKAALRFGRSLSPVPLKLSADTASFALSGALPAGDGWQVLPEGQALAVAWRSDEKARAPAQAARPPLEPSIPRAVASWVSTLEGRAALRVRYQLRLDREQALELFIPEGHRLERLRVNGAQLAPQGEGPSYTVRVAPARVGETQGTLEVTLVRELGVFHLSGKLALALPRVSWPVAELYATAHLPAVFTYRREGGSLEPEPNAAQTPALESETPLPGKPLAFRQFLVAASAPTLELAYSVDITNSYFR